MNVVATSQKYYRITTLKKLIRKLFKKFELDPTVHFDVWICGYYPNGKEDTIKKHNPFACCHFCGFKRTVKDPTNVFKWLEFKVEDYEFEIGSEYHLYVKLCDINANFRHKEDSMSDFEEMFLDPEKIKGYYEILDKFRTFGRLDDYCRTINNDYDLYFFLRYFPQKDYDLLKPDEKVNIETCVLKGIENGELDFVPGYLFGEYSYAATWAVDYIEKFDSKEKIIEAIRQHALKSPLAQYYVSWYFHKYVILDNEENLNYYKNIFLKKKNLQSNDYSFLSSFIPGNKPAYAVFRDLIEKYENSKNIPKERRIRTVELPF